MIRTRERRAVRQLLGEGMSISAMCRALQQDRKTVQPFARANSVDDLLAKAATAAGCWARSSLTSPPSCRIHPALELRPGWWGVAGGVGGLW